MSNQQNLAADADAQNLKSMGYEQELHRHMGGFSNLLFLSQLFVFWQVALVLLIKV